jgi:hypothetical protein
MSRPYSMISKSEKEVKEKRNSKKGVKHPIIIESTTLDKDLIGRHYI